MIIVNSVDDCQAILDLALHISSTERMAWKKALGEAIRRIAADQRRTALRSHYEPVEVHTSWSLPPTLGVVGVEVDVPEVIKARRAA